MSYRERQELNMRNWEAMEMRKNPAYKRHKEASTKKYDENEVIDAEFELIKNKATQKYIGALEKLK